MSKYLLFLSFVFVAGCSTMGIHSKQTSLVNYIDQNIKKKVIQFIANDLVSYLKDPLPPASTTFIIKLNNTQDQFTPLLISILQQNGYGVIYNDQLEKSKNTGMTLSYKVMPMDDGIILVARYGLTEVTRYYVHSLAGDIVSSSAFLTRVNDGGK
ncbi:hypothetical protein [Bartonella bilalgolemii]|uniref:Conjugal transfer protein TrbH n=1 Tax=Bartonella bilalgolemii TaxID=2942911 RepID=A0ABT0PAC3_9HYPH|nr:hypothetical protein [Bartonella sp. G70]MCL6230336.1 hypothetical protein [Bartonella sp. G70]